MKTGILKSTMNHCPRRDVRVDEVNEACSLASALRWRCCNLYQGFCSLVDRKPANRLERENESLALFPLLVVQKAETHGNVGQEANLLRPPQQQRPRLDVVPNASL